MLKTSESVRDLAAQAVYAIDHIPEPTRRACAHRRSAIDGKAAAAQMNGTPEGPSVIADRLHLSTGFLASERDWVVRRLGALGSRLRSFPDTEIDLEISLKDRHGTGQRVTLECWISRTPRLHLVSTSTAQELAMALNEVRDDLIRQVDDAKTRTEPRNSRARRLPRHSLDHDVD